MLFNRKQIRCYTKNTKKMNRLLKAAKTKNQRNAVNIKFGTKITCEHKEAMVFDADNGKTNWKDDELLSQSKYTTSVLLNTFVL